MSLPPSESALPITALSSGKKSKIPTASALPPAPVAQAPPGLEQQSRHSGYDADHPAPPAPPSDGPDETLGDQAKCSNQSGNSTHQQHFETHLEETQWKEGVRNGTLIKGALRVNLNRPANAYVQPEGCKARENDILIYGRRARNRAVHGDIVVIQMIQEGEAALNDTCAMENEEEQEDRMRPVVDDSSDESEEPDDSDEEILMGGRIMAADETASTPTAPLAETKGKGKGNFRRNKPHAKVRAIVDTKDGRDKVRVCTLHASTHGRPEGDKNSNVVLEGDTVLRAEPTDKRFPWILLQVKGCKTTLNIPGPLDKFQLWPVQIMKWDEGAQLPLGRLKGECLGRAGEVEAEERHALVEHSLDTHEGDFSDEIEDEVNEIVAEAKRSFESEVSRRTDLRHKRIFTIDPETARDLDDAIHVDRLPGGRQVEIGVHIADVGHFLKLGSAVDKEAQCRSTSVYLVRRVLPMLPHQICNSLCSLDPLVAKISFSAFFRLDIETGDLVEDPPPWFKKTVMSSACRLNYDEVQQMLDGEDIKPPVVRGNHTFQQVKDDIFLLKEVCGNVRKGRLDNGAMTITKSKIIFHTRSSTNGIPTGYHVEDHSASHWIIEELMLLANRCVARHLYNADSPLSEVAVLRNHKPPDKKKAEGLQNMMTQNLNIREWDGGSAGAIYRSCSRIREKFGEPLAQCVEMLVMRCGMLQAEYFVVGDKSESTHHFALNFDFYTHFTSPIRRYPDVMVHRVLAALLTGEGEPDREYQGLEKAQEQVTICNEKKSASRKCQEQLDRAMFCIYLRAQKSWLYAIGTVLAFKEDKKSGLDVITVFVPELGKEKKVLLCSRTDFEKLDLFISTDDGKQQDELMLPEKWRCRGKSAADLFWQNPKDPEAKLRMQKLQVFSCIPMVVIPTNTVPIDFQMFFVSPFHKQFDVIGKGISEEAARGFEWTQAEEDGVEIVHNADES